MKILKFAIILILLSCFVGPVWGKGSNGNGGSGAGGGFTGVLDEYQTEHLIFLREEEKLARDVYIAFAAKYGTPIFANILASEQKHMDAVKGLIDKYGLEDPVIDDTPGVFSDPIIDGLYTEFMEKGLLSLDDALQVGVEIELYDIDDIEFSMLPFFDQTDVVRVLQNLLAGSYNHLDAFETSLGLF